MRTPPRPVPLLILAAILLAGCGNDPYPAGESDGDVLYVNFGEDPRSLDPTSSFTTAESTIVDILYSTYFRYHPLKQKPVRLYLDLGAKEPLRRRLPDGGEEWTFTVRRDLRFQDAPCFPGGRGRRIDARDFVYSFQRMADPRGECPLASMLEERVLGWKAYAAAFRTERPGFADPNYDRPFPGVQVDPKDPYTFRVRLVAPYPQLRYLMAMHFTSPQAREAVESANDEYRRRPVGCGPYLLADYRPKQRIVLRRNPNAVPATFPAEGDPGDRERGLLADAGRPLPLTPTIVLNLIKESTSAWNLFLQGYLDGAGLNANNYQQVMAPNGLLSDRMREMGIRLRRTPQSAVMYVVFNTQDPLWGGLTPKKRKLRQAVSLSLDAPEFVDLALQGNGIPAQWMLPEGVFGHDPAYRNPYRQTDLARARRLMAEAGYPDGRDPATGERLVLNLDSAATTAAGRTTYGILKRQIERLGIRVEHRATNGNLFRDKLYKRRHQCILYGWFADYPDPENFLFLLYGPIARPGSPNYAQYVNPAYDALFERMRTMDDSPERRRLLDRMRDIAVEDAVWIPFYHPVSVALSHRWIRNTKAHPIANDFLIYRAVDFPDRTRARRAWNRPLWWPAAALALLLAGGAIPAARVARRRAHRRVRRDGGGA